MRPSRHLLTSAAAALAVAAGTFAPPSASAAGVRVWPLGDSITFGATYTVVRPAAVPPPAPDRTRADTPGGYRTGLSALLTATSVTHQLVGTNADNSGPTLDATGNKWHNGHPGWRIDHVSTALDGRPVRPPSHDAGGYWLTRANPVQPDVTILHIGTNDIYQRYDPLVTYRANYGNAAQRATFVAHAGDRLQALVDKIQALRPSTRIVLSNVVPLTPRPEDTATAGYYDDLAVVDYNARVAAIAAAEQARGERVVFADVWSKFAVQTPARIVVVPGLLSPDGAHPTPAGYALMSAVYRDAVAAAVALP